MRNCLFRSVFSSFSDGIDIEYLTGRSVRQTGGKVSPVTRFCQQFLSIPLEGHGGFKQSNHPFLVVHVEVLPCACRKSGIS